MGPAISTLDVRQVSVLLRGEPDTLRNWTRSWQEGRPVLCLGVILIGAGLYGAAMGAWRAPQQALLVALKFPLIILLTTLGNALLNAMIAPLLGLNITLRESFLAMLMSFTIAATILGAFSPLAAFIVWNAPAMRTDLRISGGTYSAIMLAHVGTISFAGVSANLRLVQLLERLGGNRTVARRVLVGWLVGNLLLGSQLSWILRPFIGSPELPVQFLRADALRGNFFETIISALLRVFHSF
jgi:hypothetical protein